VISVVVTVQEPAVRSVRLRDLVPDARAVLAGKATFGSVELRATVSEAVVTTFQLASTALTVTL
jgi:hypothetical protein